MQAHMFQVLESVLQPRMQPGQLHAVQDGGVWGGPQNVETGRVREMREGLLLILHTAEEYTQVSQLRKLLRDMQWVWNKSFRHSRIRHDKEQVLSVWGVQHEGVL